MCVCMHIKIEKVDMFHKVLNIQFIKNFRAILLYKQNTITHLYRLFHPLKGLSGGPYSNRVYVYIFLVGGISNQ